MFSRTIRISGANIWITVLVSSYDRQSQLILTAVLLVFLCPFIQEKLLIRAISILINLKIPRFTDQPIWYWAVKKTNFPFPFPTAPIPFSHSWGRLSAETDRWIAQSSWFWLHFSVLGQRIYVTNCVPSLIKYTMGYRCYFGRVL